MDPNTVLNFLIASGPSAIGLVILFFWNWDLRKGNAALWALIKERDEASTKTAEARSGLYQQNLLTQQALVEKDAQTVAVLHEMRQQLAALATAVAQIERGGTRRGG